MEFIKVIALISVFTLCLDYIYLSSFSNYFSKVFKEIQGTKLQLYLPGAILCYSLMIFTIYYFGFVKQLSTFDMFLLGFCIYGIYDFTNLATIKKWPIFLVMIDVTWGAFLFSSVHYLVHYFL